MQCACQLTDKLLVGKQSLPIFQANSFDIFVYRQIVVSFVFQLNQRFSVFQFAFVKRTLQIWFHSLVQANQLQTGFHFNLVSVDNCLNEVGNFNFFALVRNKFFIMLRLSHAVKNILLCFSFGNSHLDKSYLNSCFLFCIGKLLLQIFNGRIVFVQQASQFFSGCCIWIPDSFCIEQADNRTAMCSLHLQSFQEVFITIGERWVHHNKIVPLERFISEEIVSHNMNPISKECLLFFFNGIQLCFKLFRNCCISSISVILLPLPKAIFRIRTTTVLDNLTLLTVQAVLSFLREIIPKHLSQTCICFDAINIHVMSDTLGCQSNFPKNITFSGRRFKDSLHHVPVNFCQHTLCQRSRCWIKFIVIYGLNQSHGNISLFSVCVFVYQFLNCNIKCF